LTVALCALVAAAPGVAAQLVNVSPTGDANGGGIVISGLGKANATCISLVLACAPGVAISGTSDATGGVAISGGGTTNGTFLSASLLGSADSEGVTYTTQGDAEGRLLVVSVFGNATCGGQPGCFAISLTGFARGSGSVSGCVLMMDVGLDASCNEDWYAGASHPMSMLG
jgi:hypothetical protein